MCLSCSLDSGGPGSLLKKVLLARLFFFPVSQPFFLAPSNSQGKGMRNVCDFAIGNKKATCFWCFLYKGLNGLKLIGPNLMGFFVIVLFKNIFISNLRGQPSMRFVKALGP